MIVVRTEMQCKWGRVDEALANMQNTYERMQGQADAIERIRILTDMSGSQDTIIVEAEIESLDAFFGMMDAMFGSPEFKALQAERQSEDHPYVSGAKNFYKVERVYG